MSVSKNENQNFGSTATSGERDAEVLYQKLGNRWFAFSIVDDEVFMSPIGEEQITEIRSQTL